MGIIPGIIIGVIYGLVIMCYYIFVGIVWDDENTYAQKHYKQSATLGYLYRRYRWSFIWRFMVFILVSVLFIMVLISLYI